MIFERILAVMRRLNTGIALAVGVLLTLTVAFIIVDITMRQVSRSLGGSDEVSGYVMAIVASWGLSYALLELAHVRIDLLRMRLQSSGRFLLDVLSMFSVAAIACVVAFYAWPVLAKSIQQGSRANTPLETPLWIPQVLWFSGWVWFALTATVMLICAIGMLAQRQTAQFEKSFGVVADQAAEPAE
ncbi:TRAP transporter small permease subunit [Chelativorans sp. YIM 93263]|uniref:TRAP transporter small permease subunit n=1 Tax=Chelativorans sp. YIM 93263 TaxID=2906648 RepID=UPI002378D245|nr:TRAP transporter small permease [Chelativorans sp. YIM 93263]